MRKKRSFTCLDKKVIFSWENKKYQRNSRRRGQEGRGGRKGKLKDTMEITSEADESVSHIWKSRWGWDAHNCDNSPHRQTGEWSCNDSGGRCKDKRAHDYDQSDLGDSHSQGP